MSASRTTAARSGTVALALVLVLAGCTGFVPGPGDDGTDRAPYGTDDELRASADGEPDFLAPGLTADGVENESLLVERHFDALERDAGNGTYVAVRRVEIVANGTVVEEGRGRHVVDHPDRAYARSAGTARDGDGGAPLGTAETWRTADRVLTRTENATGAVRYEAEDVPDRPPGHPTALEQHLSYRLSEVNASGDVTVTERTRNGTTWYVVSADAKRYADRGIHHVAKTTLRVREDGLVERTHRTSITEGEQRAGETVRSVEFEAAPNGTLEPPDWIDEAREATDEE